MCKNDFDSYASKIYPFLIETHYKMKSIIDSIMNKSQNISHDFLMACIRYKV